MNSFAEIAGNFGLQAPEEESGKATIAGREITETQYDVLHLYSGVSAHLPEASGIGTNPRDGRPYFFGRYKGVGMGVPVHVYGLKSKPESADTFVGDMLIMLRTHPTGTKEVYVDFLVVEGVDPTHHVSFCADEIEFHSADVVLGFYTEDNQIGVFNSEKI